MFVKIHSSQMPSKMLPFFHLYILNLQVVIFVTHTIFLKVLGYTIHLTFVAFYVHESVGCQSPWPCSLQRGSVATHLLGLWVWIRPTARMSASCKCCVLCRYMSLHWVNPSSNESYWICVTECHNNLYNHNEW
jgi:hypothetical protein